MKYEAMQRTTNWIQNSSQEEFLEGFNELGDNYSGLTLAESLDETQLTLGEIKMLTQEEALQALLAGEKLEFRRKSGDWIELINKNLILDSTLEFRITPKVTIANGIEIPLGYQGKMTDKQTYFLPNLLSGSYYDPSVWVGSHYDNMMMRRGLVFLSREDAVAYADAMVRLGGGDASAF